MISLLGALKRALLPLLALLIAIFAVWFEWTSGWLLFTLIICLPIVLLGLYDWLQKKYTLTRNYPVAARIRWLFYDLRPFLRQYIVEDDLEGEPFGFEARNLVYARARGETDTHPFGSERKMEKSGYSWISHSITPACDTDQNPRVLVGNAQTSLPYNTSVLNISAMSFGALSARAIEALNLGAKLGGFYHDTGEGGLSEYHLKHGGDIVWEIGTGYFGCRNQDGRFDPQKFADIAQRDEVKMTEIKLSQGAKPGHGGLLPATKVTEEIARVRQIEAHKDCLSPRTHSAFSTPVELLEFAASMRELSGGKPVGLKLCIGQPHEVMALMKAMLKTGIYPEFIVVDGAEGGTGAAPLELSDWVGMPLKQGLIVMQNALIGTGLRQHVKLAASGKVYSGMGLAYNMAIGADWCNAARAFMFSIGCIQARRCHLGTCPTGITTQDPRRQRGLVVDVQSQRAARFHEKTVASLTEIVAAAGLRHPNELQPHHLATCDSAVEAKELSRLLTFLPEGILLDAPEETPYASWWQAADADSFKPRGDLANNIIENRN